MAACTAAPESTQAPLSAANKVSAQANTARASTPQLGNAPATESQAPSALQTPTAKKGACTFQAPVSFAERTAKWEGGCDAGKAHGLGVLRGLEGTRVALIFFGRMEKGQPKSGVIDKGGNLEVGEFKDGKVIALEYVTPEEQNVQLRAFETAIAAAKQVSEMFKTAGNAGSAKYYADQAHMLEQQIE
jgi:hypothetical protein